MSVLCALACIILSVVLSLQLSRQVFQPIGRLHHAIRQVGKNNLDVQVPVPAGRHDELGELAQQFNTMVVALRHNQQALLENQRALNRAQIRMANLSVVGSHTVNGVSKLHSEIIKDSVFHDYFLYKPQAFKNVTNGIAYRRWLLCSNPGLTHLLEETIGDGFKTDASELKKLEKFVDDKTVQAAAAKVKRENKANFANYLQKATGQVIDPDSIFDCQVKRMHEYKRQHLNALNIAAQYLYLKENPNADFIPKTYIFGAKAAPGYYMAKQMIRMICKLGDLINNDPAVREKLRVVYLEEYCVSLSEHLMPAAEVSEQISLAGTEASGTGNMKFALNGAMTVGTLDGANVEIRERVGAENFFLFGMTVDEVEKKYAEGYNPASYYEADPRLKHAIDMVADGTFSNGDRNAYSPLVADWLTKDWFMTLADFSAYMDIQSEIEALYADELEWNRKALLNVANSGYFSSDRSMEDYLERIWHTAPLA